jgi:hypothetical protein
MISFTDIDSEDRSQVLREISASAADSSTHRIVANAAAVSLWIMLTGARWARLFLERLTGAVRLQLSASAERCVAGGTAELERLFASRERKDRALAHQLLYNAACVHAVVVQLPLGTLSIVRCPPKLAPRDGRVFVQYPDARHYFVGVDLVTDSSGRRRPAISILEESAESGTAIQHPFQPSGGEDAPASDAVSSGGAEERVKRRRVGEHVEERGKAPIL